MCHSKARGKFTFYFIFDVFLGVSLGEPIARQIEV